MNPLSIKSFKQFEILGEAKDLQTMDADEFFVLQNKGISKEDVIPLGKNTHEMLYGRIGGEEVLIEKGDQDVYILCEAENFGLAMLHYVYNNVSLELVLCNNLPLRQIFNTHMRRFFSMSTDMKPSNTMSLRSMMLSENGANPAQSTPATFQTAMEEPTPSGGITPKKVVDMKRLAYFTRKYGYVIGYICNVGPAITMSFKKTKVNDTSTGINTDRYDIVAKQSKPSKVLRVLVALPRGCCMKNGSPAFPEDINNGDIDFDETATDLVYFRWKVDTAISYIGALGKALPEYGPTHGEKEHYSPEDILNANSKVGFVEIVTRKNKRKERTQGEEFIWSLKSNKRRCLFTPGNYIPLKIVNHIPTTCRNADEAYKVNQIAFSHWSKKAPKSNDSKLDLALSHTSSLIFMRQYELQDGEGTKTVDGIGSVYFMESDTIKLKDGVEVPRAPLSYVPWYVITRRGEKAPATTPVTMIASKKEAFSEKSKKTRYVNDYTTIDEVDTQAYKEYRDIIREVGHCMTTDELKSLGKERKRSVPGSASWDANIRTSYTSLIRKDSVIEDVEAIMNRYSRDQVLKA